MNRRKGLKKLFNRFAAGALLSFGLIAGGNVRADEPQQTPAAAFVEAAAPSGAPVCEAFPGFAEPLVPMHRAARVEIEPDPAVRTRQQLLRRIGMDPGPADGLPGRATASASREYLMFYAPLYDGNASAATLNETDVTQLTHYADLALTDARAKGIRTSTAAALRMASERTGADFNALVTAARRGGHLQGVRGTNASASDLFKYDTASWLYLVKTYGDKYGLGLYANAITLEQTEDGKTVPGVSNPFLYRQLLELKHHPRLSALMAGEYLVNAPDMSNVRPPALPAFDATVQQQQRDLAAIGFDTGAADGIKGTYSFISIGEFQMIYGDGVATGTLSEDEAALLKKTAARARLEGKTVRAPSAATGAIRMASERSAQDFGYMMELASAESGFRVTARAGTTSATGLYQFIESTWAWMIKLHGARYGLGDLAKEVEIYTDDLGRRQARIPNPIARGQIMDLRHNPHLSSLFSAHFQQENEAKEACWVSGELSRTALSIAPFLGAHDAVYFLNPLREDPQKSAPATFPNAAEYNENIFWVMQNGQRLRERTLQEVYDHFERKFDRNLYDAPSDPLVKGPDPNFPTIG